MGGVSGKTLTFTHREVRELVVAWLALGLAFAIFFARGGPGFLALLTQRGVGAVVLALVVSLVTAGLGFLFHELAHKVMAVRYDQVAHFRADYSMLFLAVMSALLGFLFAAPGAVHHSGRLTDRQHGLVALAGPAVNVVLSVAFAAVLYAGLAAGRPVVTDVGAKGLGVNLFLAAFNLIPFRSLDGATVKEWSSRIWVASFVPTAVVAFVVVFVFGVGFS